MIVIFYKNNSFDWRKDINFEIENAWNEHCDNHDEYLNECEECQDLSDSSYTLIRSYKDLLIKQAMKMMLLHQRDLHWNLVMSNNCKCFSETW